MSIRYLLSFQILLSSIICFGNFINSDSLVLRSKYIIKNSKNIGIAYYGWQSISFGGGEKLKYDGGGFGKLITYDHFVMNRISLTFGISHLKSFNYENKFKMELYSSPIYLNYYPRFFKNKGNFNLVFVSGYQKYTFNDDSLNFKNIQLNINFGLRLLLIPKKIGCSENKHWIFELDFGQPIYNFTKYPALPSGFIGIKYNLLE